MTVRTISELRGVISLTDAEDTLKEAGFTSDTAHKKGESNLWKWTKYGETKNLVVRTKDDTLDKNLVGNISRMLKEIQQIEEEQQAAARKQVPHDLPPALASQEKFAAYTTADGSGTIHLLDSPHIARSFNTAGNTEAELVRKAADLERDDAAIKHLTAELEKYHIRMYDKGDVFTLVQPDLKINEELAKNQPDFVDRLLLKLTEVAESAKRTADNRFEQVIDSLQQSNFTPSLAPQKDAEAAAKFPIKHIIGAIKIPTYGADIIPQEAAEKIGQLIARVTSRPRQQSGFTGRLQEAAQTGGVRGL